LERVGKVLEKRGHQALVAMQRHVACENCGRCGGILGGPDQKDERVEVDNPINASEGELVNIEVDDRQLLKVAFLVYMVPVLALLAGIFGGLGLAPVLNYGGDHTLFSVAMGLVLMAVVILAVRSWDRKVKDDSRFRPVIKSLAETPETDIDSNNSC